MTTGKTIALTIWTFVRKVMSLLFNMLSRFFIALLPRSKHVLISWLQSSSAVILEGKKIKSVIVSSFSPFIYHEVMGPDSMILVFWMLSLNNDCWLYHCFSGYLLKHLQLGVFWMLNINERVLQINWNYSIKFDVRVYMHTHLLIYRYIEVERETFSELLKAHIFLFLH